jgi:hypothetical protein
LIDFVGNLAFFKRLAHLFLAAGAIEKTSPVYEFSGLLNNTGCFRPFDLGVARGRHQLSSSYTTSAGQTNTACRSTTAGFDR